MPPGRNHVEALQSAVLVLLALLLGFTFAMAVSRFDTRKGLVLEEANAIGTTSLRAQFLSEPQRSEALALLRQYVSARLDFYGAGIDQVRLEAASAAAQGIMNRLWALAVTAAAADPRSVPTGLFAQSLNDLIDANEKRRVALDNHVPEAVVYLLLLVSDHGAGARRLRLRPGRAAAALDEPGLRCAHCPGHHGDPRHRPAAARAGAGQPGEHDPAEGRAAGSGPVKSRDGRMNCRCAEDMVRLV